MKYNERYELAHKKWFEKRYPSAWKDGNYCAAKIPVVKKANGLTRFVLQYLEWMEHRATRINSQGRLIEGLERGPTGNSISIKKWVPGTTRRGTADISATIFGRSCMFEIKIGKDKASEFQLAEQAKERRAGGIYEFVTDPDQFFKLYDDIIKTIHGVHTL